MNVDDEGKKTLPAFPALAIAAVFLISWSAFPATGKSHLSPATSSEKRALFPSDSGVTQEIHAFHWFPADAGKSGALGALLVEVSAAAGIPAWRSVADFLPSPSETIAMLARDKDVDDFAESSDAGGQAGERYGQVVDLVSAMRPLRASYAAFLAQAHASMVEKGLAKPSDGSVHPISQKGESSPPRKRDMELSHSYALDIFFNSVREEGAGGLEIGPDILSASAGIVVATSSDWMGGPGIESYRKGGISPNAGNGIIVFDPASGLFFCYFHLHDVLARAGMPVPAGGVLGRGGDTGANARKPGHGQHLHLEIYDSAAGRFLRNTEIRSMIF
jgi:hypothetical protein